MSKIKEAIRTAQTNVSKAAVNTYGARLYDFEQVCKILEDLYDVANEDESEDAGVNVTREQLETLLAKIETRIDANISNLSDSDILDEDSLEVSVSGTRASIDNIDIDKDNIASEAVFGIDDDIYDWADTVGIYTEE